MNELDLLVQHREAILLAEAIGWLHDYRKCSEEQLQNQIALTEQKLEALEMKYMEREKEMKMEMKNILIRARFYWTKCLSLLFPSSTTLLMRLRRIQKR